MKIEYIIIGAEIILMIFLLWRFIPRDKIREAHVAFLFKQLLTWSMGIIVAELRLIEYPVRFFPYANKASFSFEFFLYPAICAIFITNYPEKKNAFDRFMYYAYFCTAMSIIEVVEERYTAILKYIHWHWYFTWITLFMTFYFSIKYNEWFFRKERKQNEI